MLNEDFFSDLLSLFAENSGDSCPLLLSSSISSSSSMLAAVDNIDIKDDYIWVLIILLLMYEYESILGKWLCLGWNALSNHQMGGGI